MSIIRQNYSDCYSDMVTRSMLAPIFPTLVATKAVSKDGLFIINNTLYKATADIAPDAQIVVGTNAELASTIAEELGSKWTDCSSKFELATGLTGYVDAYEKGGLVVIRGSITAGLNAYYGTLVNVKDEYRDEYTPKIFTYASAGYSKTSDQTRHTSWVSFTGPNGVYYVADDTTSPDARKPSFYIVYLKANA